MNVKQINESFKEISPEDLYLESKGYEKVGNKHIKVRKAESTREDANYPKILIICNASIDTLPIDYVEKVEMIIVDEGHTGSQESVRNLLLNAKSAMYRYSMSATNWRDRKEDMHLLVSSFGNKIIFEEIPKVSIASGKVKAINYKQKSPPTPTDFLRDVKNPDDIIKRCIVGNKTRNQMIINDTKELLADGRTVLICVTEAAHCEVLKMRFAEIGIEALEYYSKMSREEKKENLEISKTQGSNRVVIATMALGIGVDTKAFNAIVLADARKGSNALFQRNGRGSRQEEGVKELIIIDYFDWFNPITMKWSQERARLVADYYNSDESFAKKIGKKHGLKLRTG